MSAGGRPLLDALLVPQIHMAAKRREELAERAKAEPVRVLNEQGVRGRLGHHSQMDRRQVPELVTAIYRVADRPADRVLVDYNQNAWGRTLASIYSVRPHLRAAVSTPSLAATSRARGSPGGRPV